MLVGQVEDISELCYDSLLNQFESWEEKKSGEPNNTLPERTQSSLAKYIILECGCIKSAELQVCKVIRDIYLNHIFINLVLQYLDFPCEDIHGTYENSNSNSLVKYHSVLFLCETFWKRH